MIPAPLARPPGWRVFSCDQPPSESGDNEAAGRRPPDENRPEITSSSEAGSSVDAQRPTLRGADLRPTEPAHAEPDCDSHRADHEQRAEPVERRARQGRAQWHRPRSGRIGSMRWEAAYRRCGDAKWNAARAPGDEQGEGSPSPRCPDNDRRKPASGEHRQLEPGESIAFHAVLGRDGCSVIAACRSTSLDRHRRHGIPVPASAGGAVRDQLRASPPQRLRSPVPGTARASRTADNQRTRGGSTRCGRTSRPTRPQRP